MMLNIVYSFACSENASSLQSEPPNGQVLLFFLVFIAKVRSVQLRTMVLKALFAEHVPKSLHDKHPKMSDSQFFTYSENYYKQGVFNVKNSLLTTQLRILYEKIFSQSCDSKSTTSA